MHIQGEPNCRTFTLESHQHPDGKKPGKLIRIPFAKLVPEFFPNGCPESYFITPNPGQATRRGAHGHPVGSKAEIFNVPIGRAHIHLHSAEGCGTVTLENPDEILLVIPGVWHAVDLEANSILQVYASMTMEQGCEFTELPCQCQMP